MYPPWIQLFARPKSEVASEQSQNSSKSSVISRTSFPAYLYQHKRCKRTSFKRILFPKCLQNMQRERACEGPRPPIRSRQTLRGRVVRCSRRDCSLSGLNVCSILPPENLPLGDIGVRYIELWTQNIIFTLDELWFYCLVQVNLMFLFIIIIFWHKPFHMKRWFGDQ